MMKIKVGAARVTTTAAIVKPGSNLKAITLLLTLSLMLLVASKEARGANDVQPEDLPEIVISYGLFCSRYGEFKALESNPDNVLIKLEKSFDAMAETIDGPKLDFSTRLAFGHRSFVVQTNIPGHVSGLVRVRKENSQELVIPPDGMLYVTTPIDSFGNRSLIIFSSVGPERTTIVSLDSAVRTELLYDAFQEKRGVTPGISRIDRIRVKEPGIFLLEEKTARNAPIQGPLQTGRTFLIDVTSGKFKISRLDEKK